ncbi:hypothetical protein PAHAL_7G124400 [Panicum hallii]|uniref:Uncharacterized protein n=1 Tax=Panicum hallii TaxID=206008 RepID=A0A2T8IC25_9POAL|nr:hypothetical protein PAHAL_7G124400 [Panicum hallii]
MAIQTAPSRSRPPKPPPPAGSRTPSPPSEPPHAALGGSPPRPCCPHAACPQPKSPTGNRHRGTGEETKNLAAASPCAGSSSRAPHYPAAGNLT